MHGIPFLVTNGKHGDYATLENLKSGIQIWHRDLDYVVVSPDGTYATIGGGVKVKQVVDTLSAANKRAGMIFASPQSRANAVQSLESAIVLAWAVLCLVVATAGCRVNMA